MEQLVERCAGVDVGRAELRVCARVPDRRGRVAELIASYGTTTPDLLALHEWLQGLGVTQVAMESTGVYWKPLYYLLEDDFEVLLVNAAHVKHVPGRKTDTIDAAWRRSCWPTACCGRVSCRPRRSGSCATSPATARR